MPLLYKASCFREWCDQLPTQTKLGYFAVLLPFLPPFFRSPFLLTLLSFCSYFSTSFTKQGIWDLIFFFPFSFDIQIASYFRVDEEMMVQQAMLDNVYSLRHNMRKQCMITNTNNEEEEKSKFNFSFKSSLHLCYPNYLVHCYI